jgi:NAD(P)-dependent dehydrogenase (short-subunit alcohol dehydrogenase family)
VEEAIPIGRSCHPEDLAKVALFFASDESKYITGANLMVDGGWSVKGL